MLLPQHVLQGPLPCLRDARLVLAPCPGAAAHPGAAQQPGARRGCPPAPRAEAAPAAPARKRFDVTTLGNLCVDVAVRLPEVPPPEVVKTPAYLEQLMASPPARDVWEVGGSCNFAIAAARLGLRTALVGNLGRDSYGTFLADVLREEGLAHLEPLTVETREGPAELARTLLCFVLLDALGRHAFCSAYDFGPWPLLPGVNALSAAALQVLASSAAVFINGFLLDELPAGVVVEAMAHARARGGATFFDPGPRAWMLMRPERRAGFLQILDHTDVVLMTQEEAEAITGLGDPEQAAWAVLGRAGACTQWAVVKLGARGAVLCTRSPRTAYRQHALQVEVQDTVGCGDSFGAAIVLGYTRQHDIPATVMLANAVGAATARGRGAGRNVATAEGVAQLLARDVGAPAAGAAPWVSVDEASWQGAGNGAAVKLTPSQEALGLLQASLARGGRPGVRLPEQSAVV